MSKYLIWCFKNGTRTEKKAKTEKEAYRIFKSAIESGNYTSVSLRKELFKRGYLIDAWSYAGDGLGALGTKLTEADVTKILILKREEPDTYFIIKVLGDDEDFIVIMNESDDTNVFTSADMAYVMKNINANNLPVYMYMVRKYDEPVLTEGILDICSCDELVELKNGNYAEWFSQEDVCPNAEDEVEKFVFDFTSDNEQLLFTVDVPLNSHRFMIEEKLFVKLDYFESLKSVYGDKFLNVVKAQGVAINDKYPVISSIVEAICIREGWKYHPVAFINSEMAEVEKRAVS